MTQPRKLTVDIWSDVMCPWCLIGYGQLQKALKQLDGEIEADIRWHAFELNPDMPPEGEVHTDHIRRKYGRPADQAAAVRGQIAAAAEDAGVSIAYQGTEPELPLTIWNTFAAHKLLTWAAAAYGAKKQTELKLALFHAHFNQHRAIGDRDVLLDVAQQVGLDRTAAAVALDDEALSQQVRAEERAAYEMNVTGVPAMVIEGRFMVPGAQGAETYVDVLRKVAEKTVA